MESKKKNIERIKGNRLRTRIFSATVQSKPCEVDRVGCQRELADSRLKERPYEFASLVIRARILWDFFFPRSLKRSFPNTKSEPNDPGLKSLNTICLFRLFFRFYRVIFERFKVILVHPWFKRSFP